MAHESGFIAREPERFALTFGNGVTVSAGFTDRHYCANRLNGRRVRGECRNAEVAVYVETDRRRVFITPDVFRAAFPESPYDVGDSEGWNPPRAFVLIADAAARMDEIDVQAAIVHADRRRAEERTEQ